MPSPITVLESEPLSIVLLHPISTLFPIITAPMCGYLMFEFPPGKKPKPFLPTTAPSKILTLFPTIVFFKITFEPIAVSYTHLRAHET